jgi:hypothetical protein
MEECQLKGLCYNFDEKYFPKNKCNKQNLFMAISKDVVDKEAKSSPVEDLPPIDDTTPHVNPPEVKPLISLHALTSFSTPQTLKLIGYIKHRKVVILVGSGSTHNFIHHRIS